MLNDRKVSFFFLLRDECGYWERHRGKWPIATEPSLAWKRWRFVLYAMSSIRRDRLPMSPFLLSHQTHSHVSIGFIITMH